VPRFVAFLRGVSPSNAKMPELKHCFEQAGFTNVKTVLSSGNVVFDARSATASALELKAEEAMQKYLQRSFYTIVRSTEYLQTLLVSDPYAGYKIPVDAKRVVSFSRLAPTSKMKLPWLQDDSHVLCVQNREVFTAYVPNAKGPVFMQMIAKAFGTDVTTRTWETVEKCARA
jgi:uncharacterized protein (DUF1697 family)